MKNLIMYVILPGIIGFSMSYMFVIPQILAMNPSLPFFMLASVVSTGLLTFALAAVLRGRFGRTDDEEEILEVAEA